MASKRFAEYRSIGDKAVAAAYRSSFRYYDENRLLVSMFTYACGSALFLGVFIIRYHLELILVGAADRRILRLLPAHRAQEKQPGTMLRRSSTANGGLMIYLAICLVVFVVLMFVEIPWLYELFNVTPSQFPALWRFS